MTADIIWPSRYTPGTTDNYVSNEVIVKGLSAAQVWCASVPDARCFVSAEQL